MREHFSYSQYRMYLRCPKQYEIHYIHGINEPPGSALVLGSATHRALEYGFKEHMETGEAPPLAFIKEAASAAVAEQFKEIAPSEIKWAKDDSPGNMVDTSIGLVTAYDPTRLSITPIRSENQFALDIGAAVPLVGFVDVETTRKIIDLKTGKKSKAWNAAEQSEQLTIYQAARTEPVESLELHVLVKTKTPKVQILTVPPRSAAEVMATFDNIAVVTRAVAAGNFPKMEEDQIGSPCGWCGFYERCRGRKRPQKPEEQDD